MGSVTATYTPLHNARVSSLALLNLGLSAVHCATRLATRPRNRDYVNLAQESESINPDPACMQALAYTPIYRDPANGASEYWIAIQLASALFRPFVDYRTFPSEIAFHIKVVPASSRRV
jgi:predicted neuraminidase